MSIASVLMIVVSVALSAGSQIVLKYGMTAPQVRGALDGGNALEIVRAIALSPQVMVGLAAFGLSAVVWLFVLSRIALSSAYPFVALGIMVTVTAGAMLFGEPMTAAKLVGVTLIVGGVVMVGLAA